MLVRTTGGYESLSTSSWRSDRPDLVTTYTRNRPYESGFSKPDKPVINPLVDGYRKPSPYNCPAFSRIANQQYNRYAVLVYDVEGFNEYPDGSSGRFFSRQDSGRGAGFVEIPLQNMQVDNVRMKLLNNVRDEVLDVAMVLAEISSTADTLGTNLMRLARSMDQVKLSRPDSFYYLLTGRRRDGRRPTQKFLKETSGAYLEWKYGIMPTVYDIRGACKGLDMAQDGSLFDNPPLLVARAVDKVESTHKVNFGVSMPDSAHATGTCILKVKQELKARLDYKVSGEGLRGLNRYGLGLGTVATVAFDKTPFSFVLNMAVPIADLIKAWTALAGVDVVGYSETNYAEASVEGGSQVVKLWNTFPVTVTPKSKEKAWVHWTRIAPHTVPMPLPFVRNPVKVGNIATVLALFTQLRKG